MKNLIFFALIFFSCQSNSNKTHLKCDVENAIKEIIKTDIFIQSFPKFKHFKEIEILIPYNQDSLSNEFSFNKVLPKIGCLKLISKIKTIKLNFTKKKSGEENKKFSILILNDEIKNNILLLHFYVLKGGIQVKAKFNCENNLKIEEILIYES
jgi:hypothetical protein